MKRDLSNKRNKYNALSVAESLDTIIGARFGVIGDRIESAVPLSVVQNHFLFKASEEAGLSVFADSKGNFQYIDVDKITDSSTSKLAQMANDRDLCIYKLRKFQSVFSEKFDINLKFDSENNVLVVPKKTYLTIPWFFIKLQEAEAIKTIYKANGDIAITDINVEKFNKIVASDIKIAKNHVARIIEKARDASRRM